MTYRSALKLLVLVLTLKALAVILFISSEMVGLGPDEAQYWTWSQQLALGYYSKPPGIAWQIWLGTTLLSNTELGVRLGAVLLSAGLALATYYLARACRLQGNTCLWAGVVMAFSPLGYVSSLLAITDGGLVFFWALACVATCRGLASDKPLPYYAIGAAIFGGALFKWPIYLLWPCVIAMVCLRRRHFSWHLFGGIALSLLGLLPSVIWNMQHDWPTFKHVLATIDNGNIEVGTTGLLRGNFFEFFAAQMVLLSPIFFLLLLAALLCAAKEWKRLSAPLQFCALVTFVFLASYCGMAIFKKMQGNWCDFVYPTAVVLLCWYANERLALGNKLLKAGLMLSLVLLVVLQLLPFLIYRYPGMNKVYPFKHNAGWQVLAPKLVVAGYDPEQNFLFSDKYQTTSILSFYGPSQKRAYFFNLQGIRKNQFSYWPGLEQHVGETGFFVVAENAPALNKDRASLPQKYVAKLDPYFEHVEYLGEYPLVQVGSQILKSAFFFKCSGYLGNEPAASAIY